MKKLVINCIVLLTAMSISSCRQEPVPDDLTKYGECTEYSCPMHPDRTSTRPASCPECSMDMRPLDTVPDVIRPE